MNKTATYTLAAYADGTAYIKTTVEWQRSFGKCKLRRFFKHGEIYTQSRFRYWCKKYNLTIDEELVKLLPKKI